MEKLAVAACACDPCNQLGERWGQVDSGAGLSEAVRFSGRAHVHQKVRGEKRGHTHPLWPLQVPVGCVYTHTSHMYKHTVHT